jgi:acylglycerol lipase
LAFRMRDTFWQPLVTPVARPSGRGQPSESSAMATEYIVNADKVTMQPDPPAHVTVTDRQQKGVNTTSSGGGVEEVGVADRLEGHVTGVGHVRLYWQGWLPKGRVNGVVLLCHGACEHSGRYQNVVDTLVPDGWAVYGVDHRGHGLSGGERVHVERFSDWVDDFDLFKREVAVGHRDLPVFVLGHSLGGQIALAYALDHQQELRGLVLSAPYLAAMSVPPVVQPVARLASRFFPKTRFKLVDLDKISKDPNVVRDYRSDPLVYQGNATLTMANIVASQFDVLIDRSRDLRIPVLIQHGNDDTIADPDGGRRLAEACGSLDKTFRLYPGLWHEIYNEPERQRPLNDVREWLANHR